MTQTLRELRARATKGPWQRGYRQRPDGMYAEEIYDALGETIAALAWYPVQVSKKTTATNREENSRFIVALVNAFDRGELVEKEIHSSDGGVEGHASEAMGTAKAALSGEPLCPCQMRAARQYLSMPDNCTQSLRPHGCICPPGSEETCKGFNCPRNPPLGDKFEGQFGGMF